MIVRRGLRRSGNRRYAFNFFGKQGRPVKRLLRTHGPADHQRKVLDAKCVTQQLPLHHHVVANCCSRKSCPVEWFRRIAGRRRQAVAGQVRHHDEILVGIERLARTNEERIVIMRAIKTRWVHNDVALVRVQGTMRLVREFGVRQSDSALQQHVARIENLVVPHRLPASVRLTIPMRNWVAWDLRRLSAHRSAGRPGRCTLRPPARFATATIQHRVRVRTIFRPSCA